MRRALPVVGALCAVLAPALPVAADTPMGTALTYQGRLASAGSPANGPVDMKFTVYDAPTAGTPVATTTVAAVQVTNGLFTVKLDFGPLPWPAGAQRWLEIQVSPPGGPILTPRQELTPSPYSLFSSYTDPAHLTSLNATNITSGTVPSAAISGTYSNATTFSSPGNVFVGDGSGLTNLNAQAKYARTVVVSPVGDGSSATANGTVLMAALAGITTATVDSRWLLKIEPGLYDIGTASFVMTPYVDVEGSGELTTRIRAAGHATNDTGTVKVVANTELRFISAESTGGAAYAKAVYVSAAAPRITHVTAIASGATNENQGFFFDNGATPTVVDGTANVTAIASAYSLGVLDVASSSVLIHVNATATGGQYSRGFFACCGSAESMRDSIGTATGAVVENHGIAIYDSAPTLERVSGLASGAATNNLGILINGSASPAARHVVCRGLGATNNNWGCLANFGALPNLSDVTAVASGGIQARGLEYDSLDPAATLSNVRATASGATGENSGVKINNSSVRVTDLDVTASGGGTAAVYGLYLSGGAPTVSHVTASVSSTSTSDVAGVWIDAGTPTLSHVTASGKGAGNASGLADLSPSGGLILEDAVLSGNGSAAGFGLYVEGGAVLTHITGRASGAGNNLAAVFYNPTLARLSDARLSAATGNVGSEGVQILGTTGTVTLDRTTLTADYGVGLFNAATIHIAESQLEGAIYNSGGGTLTCLRVYDASYANLNGVCQ